MGEGDPMIKQICAPRIFGRAFLLPFVVLLASTLILAQGRSPKSESPASAQMRGLNNSLLGLHGQMQQAGPIDIRMVRGQAATVIAQRASALSKLIQNNPKDALSF